MSLVIIGLQLRFLTDMYGLGLQGNKLSGAIPDMVPSGSVDAFWVQSNQLSA